MSNSKYSATPVATVTLIFGEDVSDMNPQQLIQRIKVLKDTKKANNEIGVSSTFVTAENGKIDSAIAVLVKELDKNTPAEAAPAA